MALIHGVIEVGFHEHRVVQLQQKGACSGCSLEALEIGDAERINQIGCVAQLTSFQPKSLTLLSKWPFPAESGRTSSRCFQQKVTVKDDSHLSSSLCICFIVQNMSGFYS